MFGFFPGLGLDNALVAPPGTSIPMAQASPPPGWNSSAVSDTSFRYNSGSGGSSGGSVNWSAWNFGGTFNVTAFSLNSSQLPVHAHTIPDPGHAHTSPGHVHTADGGFGLWTLGPGNSINFPGGSSSFQSAATSDATAVTINTAFTGQNATNNAGSGSSVNPTYTTPQVKFVDHILAVKL